jgi:hypothetical protein
MHGCMHSYTNQDACTFKNVEIYILQEQLAPVLSAALADVSMALPADLRICLLQLLPSLALQPGAYCCVLLLLSLRLV